MSADLSPPLPPRPRIEQSGGPKVPVILHSDGNITAILDDLARGGIDALNLIQTGALDFETVARQDSDKN